MIRIKPHNDLLSACLSRVEYELAQERMDAWEESLLRKKRAKIIKKNARELQRRGVL